MVLLAKEQVEVKLTPQEIVEKTTIADVYRAVKNLDGVIYKTKLIYSDYFSNLSHNDIYIKPENLQKTGSFKLRGAYNCISQLSEEQKAQGVAYAAQQLGVKAVIVMPATTPLLKVEATRAYGAEVVLSGDSFDDAAAKAVELQQEFNYTFIHPFNDIEVILSQGATALEIIDDLKDVDAILVPIGGGGFASGVALATKMVNPHVKVIGVEPEGAASTIAALKEDHPVPLSEVATIADGTAVRQIGETTLKYIKKYVDEIVTVSDYELMEAFLLLVEKHKLVAENSGILPLAGLKKLDCKGKKAVAIVSGGNIDVLTISSMINKGLVLRGRIFTFSVNLPDKPGQLVAVSQMLADADANVIKLDHNQFKNLDRFHEVELQVTVETNGEEHIKHIIDTFKNNGYIIKRLNSSEILSE